MTGSVADMTREATRFARAWTEAGAEVAMGATRIVGTLAGDLSDAIFGGFWNQWDDQVDRYGDEEGYSDEYAEGPGPRGTARDLRGQGRDINRSVGAAIRDSARLVQRSMDRFSRAYDEAPDEQSPGEPPLEGRPPPRA